MSEPNNSDPVIEINIIEGGHTLQSLSLSPEHLNGSRKGFEGITADLLDATSQVSGQE